MTMTQSEVIGIKADYYKDSNYNARVICQLCDQLLALMPEGECGLPIDHTWLREIGFREMKFQGDEVLSMNFESKLGDTQWIETSEMPTMFMLCRWPESYSEEDDDVPPDRVAVNVTTREHLLQILAALGINSVYVKGPRK